MEKISIPTSSKRQIIDITGDINKCLQKEHYFSGICHLFVLHTTAALTTADLDPGTDLDMLDAFEKLIPKLTFRHPHNPKHVPDHILASLIGPDLTVAVEDTTLLLGTWQRVILVELDGPRKREIVISMPKNTYKIAGTSSVASIQK